MVDDQKENQKLKSYFSTMNVEEDFIQKMTQIAVLKHYTPGEQILEVGERTTDVGLITTGLVRGYYLDASGNDITKCFSEENDWCCSYNFLTDAASPFYLEAIEETTIAMFNVEQSRQIIRINPKVQETVDRLVSRAFVESEKRVLSFAGMEAKDRYLTFRTEHPQIVKRAKQEYIASYLGITPSSLSRIKKSI